MREFVKFEKQFKYPHMRDFEISLIERFITKFPNAYDTVAYSYPVGVPPPFNPIVNEVTEGSEEYLYQRKIDMVAKKGNAIDIIEVKRKAGSAALGQVRGYMDLFNRDEAPLKVRKLIVLTDQADNDLLHMALKQGIDIIVV